MYNAYLPEIFEMISKENPDFDSTYSRPDIFAKDTKALAEELTIARTQKLLSQFEAIKRYNDYSDEEAEEEMERIEEESKELIEDAQDLMTNQESDGEDGMN